MDDFNKNQLSVLVVSNDGYSDFWDGFFDCLEKYWKDCPFNLYLANNEKKYERHNVNVINCGKDAQWSTRTRKALEVIDSKYVCFLLEDFFISSTVETDRLVEAVEFMEINNLKYYKLMSLSKFDTNRYNGIDYLYEIPSNYLYGISLMAAIWEKEKFAEKIGFRDYNPWVFEVERLQEEETSSALDLIGVFDSRNILNICHMAVQGKYLPSSLKYMKRHGYVVDVGSRKVMCLTEYYRHRLKQLIAPWVNRNPIVKSLLNRIFKMSVSLNTLSNIKSKKTG